MRRRPTIAAVLLLLTSSAAHADTIAGRASIIDADTIEIHGERIRILDVDAPESRQPCFRPDGTAWRCGQKAALALADSTNAPAFRSTSSNRSISCLAFPGRRSIATSSRATIAETCSCST